MRLLAAAAFVTLPLGTAEYCDERVCLFVWLSVGTHISGTI